MNFSLYYRKKKNEDLFNTLEKSNLGLNNLQNYVPIYEKFFSLNSTNYNNINLNQKYYLHSVNEEINKNCLNVDVLDNSNNILKKNIFCKFSPLLDPLKYLTGKYDINDEQKIILPQFDIQNIFSKLNDKNNSAYVDAFFTYLSSQLLHNYNFLNGIDYYGSFLGIQSNFLYNIVDDMEYLNESDFFHKNKNNYFSIDSAEHDEYFNIDSRTNKKKIIINEKLEKIELDNINKNDEFSVFSLNKNNTDSNNTAKNTIIELNDVCIYNQNLKTTKFSKSTNSSSSCSSKSSNTSCESDCADEESVNNDSDNDSDNSSETDSESEAEEENISCSIYNFPIQIISLEKCENTLDYLMENKLLENHEWTSCLFQIILSLASFQKIFSFTHNDLHTNNIMFITTEKQYIYYTFNKIHYKVPTYGKIYKIIDFGRAIYKFNGQLMCSDSFHQKGDAASQYNFEPYIDDKKPRLEPNYSFDLCRLACCLYDFFIDDSVESTDVIKNNKIAALINSWLIDDKGRNILYKNSGEERYPEFKLYKMIARTIHCAIPSHQLDNPLFNKYIISKKKINKNVKIINIDNIPQL